MELISTSEVIDWAKDFLEKANKEITQDEQKEQKKYSVLIQNPNDKTLLSKMLDESSQIHNNRKLARRIKLLIEKYGVPEFFSSADVFMLKLFTYFGYWFDFVSVPIFKYKLRSDTSKVIINEKPSRLNRHLTERRFQKIGQNVNLLGEVVLGDKEASYRYEHYLEALKDPQINYISIKISGIYAQINPLNYGKNKADLCERLASIYQQSIDYPYTDAQGNLKPKFVNLDMEEYKDTELTFDVFKTVLSLPQFKNYSAGIVVQAYLPDAWNFQTELLDFARRRFADGGAPLKMRLVKGANLQMESIVSSLKGWENPVLHSKVEVDANYLHILDRAFDPDNANALNIGVASHNFFSIGYAYLLSQKMGVENQVTFEMLEGMANHLPRVFRHLERHIILYTPVVKNEHFLNAVSYLVRRMDENTGKDNFLSYSFNLTYDSDHWNFLKKQFLEAYNLKDKIKAGSFRTQDRNQVPKQDSIDINIFSNEPDTNFDLKANRLWADKIREQWKKSVSDKPYQIPVQIGDKQYHSKEKKQYFDRSQTDDICVCEANLSNLEQVQEMLNLASVDSSGWRKTTLEERNRILHQVAFNLSTQRGNLIGCMAAVTGKTFGEGDVEVSEAIDFCRFYPVSMKSFTDLRTIECSPKGIVFVISPWNFPLAIPTGGVAAALSGGNTVILKPATVALPVAWELAKCFWDAGVPKDALQIVCTSEREPLNYLTSHPDIKHMILTGGTDTAFRLLENNPTCPLSAETGGKNAIILTASGDRDHAIQNIVTSAFSNAGQKCSACSLLLLEKEVFNDPSFKLKLIDAVTSIHTGSVWDGGNVVGPMITNENEKLLRAINNLENGESWLVKPEFADERHFILKPCVKWGVKPGSFTFKNELFAPLLGVACIDNLEHGIKLMNSTEYGLTSGLQSLDESEQSRWTNKMEAGNLYINRGITGAIVNRQPFGGMKHSAFGGGIKAGGRNYVSCFVDIKEKYNPDAVSIKKPFGFVRFSLALNPTEKTRFEQALASYQESYEKEFSKESDINRIMGEKNVFRYMPLKKIALRVQASDNLCDILMILAASKTVKTPLTVSINKDDEKINTIENCVGKDFPIILQSDQVFLAELGKYERIRTCSDRLPDEYYKKAALTGKYIVSAKPLVEGRIELLNYVKEQSIAFEYHRYGSISEQV
jgi:RHH-type transcriptional regulator, proline utilization regulon repressor / proline dehydrogenase / delta 1-pyrroline-5-carboxylate dehydrogenase